MNEKELKELLELYKKGTLAGEIQLAGIVAALADNPMLWSGLAALGVGLAAQATGLFKDVGSLLRFPDPKFQNQAELEGALANIPESKLDKLAAALGIPKELDKATKISRIVIEALKFFLGIVLTVGFIEFMYEEAIQAAYFGLFPLSQFKLFGAMRDQLMVVDKMIEKLENFLGSWGRLNPFTYDAYNAFVEGAKSLSNAYKTVLASLEQQGRVRPQAGTEITRALPNAAILFINSTPQRARIDINGRFAGFTPRFNVSLPAGRHEIRFRKRKPIRADVTITVDVKAGDILNIDVDLATGEAIIKRQKTEETKEGNVTIVEETAEQQITSKEVKEVAKTIKEEPKPKEEEKKKEEKKPTQPSRQVIISNTQKRAINTAVENVSRALGTKTKDVKPEVRERPTVITEAVKKDMQRTFEAIDKVVEEKKAEPNIIEQINSGLQTIANIVGKTIEQIKPITTIITQPTSFILKSAADFLRNLF